MSWLLWRHTLVTANYINSHQATSTRCLFPDFKVKGLKLSSLSTSWIMNAKTLSSSVKVLTDILFYFIYWQLRCSTPRPPRCVPFPPYRPTHPLRPTPAPLSMDKLEGNPENLSKLLRWEIMEILYTRYVCIINKYNQKNCSRVLKKLASKRKY